MFSFLYIFFFFLLAMCNEMSLLMLVWVMFCWLSFGAFFPLYFLPLGVSLFREEFSI